MKTAEYVFNAVYVFCLLSFDCSFCLTAWYLYIFYFFNLYLCRNKPSAKTCAISTMTRGRCVSSHVTMVKVIKKKSMIWLHPGNFPLPCKMASSVSTGATTTVSTGPQNQSIRQKISDFGTFLYNSEEGSVLGRSGRNWGKIFFNRKGRVSQRILQNENG